MTTIIYYYFKQVPITVLSDAVLLSFYRYQKESITNVINYYYYHIFVSTGNDVTSRMD